MVVNIKAMAEKVTLLDLSIDNRSLLQSLANQKKAVEEQKKVLADLKKTTGEGTVEYQKATIALKELEGEYKSTQKVAVSLTTDINKQDVTIAEARKQLTAVSIQWAEQAKLYGENSKQAQELAKRKLELTEKLKLEEKATGDTRRNVGNYAQGMLEAIKGSKAFGDTLGAVGKINPFGLLLTALTLVLSSLKGLKPVIDTVSSVLAGFQAVITVVSDRIIKFAGAIGELVRGNFKAAFQEARDSIKGLGEEAAAESQRAFKNTKLLKALSLEEAQLQVKIAENNKRIAEEKIKAENKLLFTAAQRQAAAERANQIIIENEQLQLDLLVRRQKALDELAKDAPNDEQRQRDALANQAALFQAQTQSLERQKEGIAKINEAVAQQQAQQKSITDKAKADALKVQQDKDDAAARANEAELQRLNDLLLLYDAFNQSVIEGNEELTASDIEQEQKRLQTRRDIQLQILDEQLKQAKITKAEFAAQEQELMNQFNQGLLDSQKAFSDQATANALLALETAKTTLEGFEAIRVANIEAQQRLDIEQANGDFERQRIILEAQYNAEIEAANKLGADLSAIEDFYSIKRQQIIDNETQARQKSYADMFGAISELLGENTIAGKLAGIAQATINTYLGVTEALKMSYLPLVGTAAIAARVVNVASVIASGLAAVKNISGVNIPKFEDGGGIEIGGNRHSAGGTKFVGSDGTRFEAENGEKLFILNRNASKEFNALAGFNEQYRVNAARPNYYASGGEVARAAATDVQQQQLGADIINAFQKVTIVTDVKDVIDQVGLRNQLTDLATI